MKNTTKFLFLFFVLFSSSCRKEEVINNENYSFHSSHSVMNGKTRGIEIFKTVMFLQGDLVDKFDLLSKSKSEMLTQFNLTKEQYDEIDLFDKFINKIDELDPLFFQNFEADMTSGDPAKVKEALTKATMSFYKALLKDKTLSALMYSSSFLTSKIDFSKIIDSDGKLNAIKLNNEITRVLYSDNSEISRKVLNSFGMSPDIDGVDFALSKFVLRGAISHIYYGLHYAVGYNVGAFVNAFLGINVYIGYNQYIYVNKTGNVDPLKDFFPSYNYSKQDIELSQDRTKTNNNAYTDEGGGIAELISDLYSDEEEQSIDEVAENTDSDYYQDEPEDQDRDYYQNDGQDQDRDQDRDQDQDQDNQDRDVSFEDYPVMVLPPNYDTTEVDIFIGQLTSAFKK